MSVVGVFLVRIFSHSNWIRRDTEYLSGVSLRIQSKCRKIRTKKKNSQHGYSSHSANSTKLFSYAVIRCNKWIYFASAMGLNHDAIALEFYANYVHHMKLFLTDYYVPPQNRGYECIFIYLCWKIYFFNFSELMLLKYVN